MDYEGRIRKLQQRLDGERVDALLVNDLANVRYLTGFSGTNAQVLVTPSDAAFFSDPRYESRAADLVHGADVVIYPSKLVEILPGRLSAAGIDRLGIEARSMTISDRDDLGEALERVELVSTSGVVEDMRRRKDDAELELIGEAVRLTDETFGRILERLSPGMTERDIALELEVLMKKAGADAVSFEPIVGSGPLSAHIHHTPTDRALEKGDLVLLDFGCRWEGYCSDLTRTVVLGPATDEQRDVYETVLSAQSAGIDALAPDAPGRDVDAAARRVIDDAGHGAAFGHGLGHGVGLGVHESPRLHRVSEDTLVERDVVTVEPGIYLRGTGGVRTEDCVVVAQEGPRVLGRAPKYPLLEL